MLQVYCGIAVPEGILRCPKRVCNVCVVYVLHLLCFSSLISWCKGLISACLKWPIKGGETSSIPASKSLKSQLDKWAKVLLGWWPARALKSCACFFMYFCRFWDELNVLNVLTQSMCNIIAHMCHIFLLLLWQKKHKIVNWLQLRRWWICITRQIVKLALLLLISQEITILWSLSCQNEQY